jgi:hypothetical protein
MTAYMSHGFKATEWAGPDPWSTDTGLYEVCIADNYWEDIMLQMIRDSYVRPIPKPTWKLTPARSITVRPEIRIKQPVARAGYRRGNRE